MPYETRVVQAAQELATLYKDWELLRRQQACPRIDQHPAWVTLKASRMDTGQVLAVTLYECGRLVGIAPLIQSRWHLNWRVHLPGIKKRLARFTLNTIDFCGESLIAPQDEQAYQTLLAAMYEACASCDALRFESLSTESMLWHLLQADRRARGHRWLWQPLPPSPRRMIRLGTTFEEYLTQQFSKETSRKLRQEVRQLEKACGKPLVFQAVTKCVEIPAYLTKVERLSANSWQGKQLGNVVRNTETEREHLGALANQGWLLCYLLSAGDDPLAFLIGHYADGIYYADRTGYDLRWARRGPGKVIWYKTLEHLHSQRDMRWLDFCHDDREYKQFFANTCYQETGLFLIRQTVRTGIAFAYPVSAAALYKTVSVVLARIGLLPAVRRLGRNFLEGRYKRRLPVTWMSRVLRRRVKRDDDL
jgi:CelD/BcsL family acetyltransferase involved in cellulose biosynthesis